MTDPRLLISQLLSSEDPAIRWRILVRVLGEEQRAPKVRAVEDEIRRSARVRALLSRRDATGRIVSQRTPYDKWQGAHWILAALADLGYPEGDDALAPVADQVQEFWLQRAFFDEFPALTQKDAYQRRGVPVIQGRHRRCASQQGNALRALTHLGLAANATARLAERLRHWQWPDGGWNCDKNPDADSSSFMETLLPMRGLAIHAAASGDALAWEAARRAAEVFLSRGLFRRRRDHAVMDRSFLVLHCPLYWHYDILGGLIGMAELGLAADPRCSEALDVLESRALALGGWAAGARYYRVASAQGANADYVDWGGVSKRRRNDWVTADALHALRAAGRIDV
ncbi:MAG: hypothetical protein HYV63_09785 [Candidatus Schekmanbacteria bacterium]|nr:hypothetical protein [Candidatus Schekmanbacteria bacterium]